MAQAPMAITYLGLAIWLTGFYRSSGLGDNQYNVTAGQVTRPSGFGFQ